MNLATITPLVRCSQTRRPPCTQGTPPTPHPAFLHLLHKLFLAAAFLLSHSQVTSTAAEADLRLVPFPKHVQFSPGQFHLRTNLTLVAPAADLPTLTALLDDELALAQIPHQIQPQPVTSPYPVLRLTLTPPQPDTTSTKLEITADGGPEAYALQIDSREIVAVAREPDGLLRAAQTLRQLIRANRQGDALPCLTLRDWPFLRWRAFQDDLTRGPSSTADTLRFETALGAYLKFNLMTYYMESQFAFAKHPDIGPTNGSIAPADLDAWVAHARPLHLDILGNLQSFGHFGRILSLPAYTPLRETPDILTPVREESYQLLDDFYSEICPHLPFPWFNVCCDETYGLGSGPSKDLAAQIGPGGVYVRHLRRVHDLLRDRHGKRMMMWGDIILQHPDKLTELPKDTLMLTWGYDARPSFEDQILPFARSGFEFFVCPGVNNWSRILPDFGVAITNIQQFVRDGVKHGALGMINTDWEDDGEALNAVKWHADAWAAECAWNGSTTSIENFNRRVGAVLFGEPGDRFGQAIAALTQLHRLPAAKGLFNSRFWENDFAAKSSPAAIRRAATNLLAVVSPARAQLEACRSQAVINHHILDVLLFNTRRVERIGLRMLDGLTAAQLYQTAWQTSLTQPDPNRPAPAPTPAPANPLDVLDQVAALVRQNRDAHAQLGRDFATLWLRESKPYALDWTLKRYTNTVASYDTLLAKLATARTAAANQQPLPTPDDLGLALPRPISRSRSPHVILATPLEPSSPWLDPAAPQRFGLTVHSGTRDRFDLPIEVDLPTPTPHAGRPVRAFQLTPNGPRELLAQLDACTHSETTSPQPGASSERLTVLLSGPVPKETEVNLHIYLDASPPHSSPSEAASTQPGPHNTHQLENNCVRLVLGPEGAHIYRWELKGATNRDLTMPGDSGWAGFSDQGALRHVRHHLECTARGPALVEFVATPETGPGKTLRLFANSSSIEVFTHDPTPVYWDFDDPNNFAADGPTPGTWLFSNGQSGPVGRQADGVPAQVEAHDTLWGLKYNPNHLALGLISPGHPALHHVAPGAGAGGVGIEHSTPAQHFVTFAGLLDASPTATFNRLEATLDLTHPVQIRSYASENRPTTTGLPPAPSATSNATPAQPTTASRNPFFALCMDTHDTKHRSLAEQATLLKELGYDGAGHLWLDQLAERLQTLDNAGLKLFQIYFRVDLAPTAASPFDARLRDLLPSLKDRNVMLALLITGGKPSDAALDPRAIEILTTLARLCEPYHVRLALYPHAGDWLERVEDAWRIAEKANRPDVGVMFNLCHWLRVTQDPDPRSLLTRVHSRLFAVTINGADPADKDPGWKGLIQPLGRGSFDINSLLRTLRDLDYSGPIGLQCYGLEGDARDHLAESIRAWRQYPAVGFP